MGGQARATMIDLIGVSIILEYQVEGPFLFFICLLLMVWEGFPLVINVGLGVLIIAKDRGCSIWLLWLLGHGEVAEKVGVDCELGGSTGGNNGRAVQPSEDVATGSQDWQGFARCGP